MSREPAKKSLKSRESSGPYDLTSAKESTEYPEELKPNQPRKKLKIILAIAIFILTIIGLLVWYLKPWQNLAGVQSPVVIKEEPSNKESVPTKIEVVGENLKVPWSIVFTSENRILVTEREGNIRIVENGSLAPSL